MKQYVRQAALIVLVLFEVSTCVRSILLEEAAVVEANITEIIMVIIQKVAAGISITVDSIIVDSIVVDVITVDVTEGRVTTDKALIAVTNERE